MLNEGIIEGIGKFTYLGSIFFSKEGDAGEDGNARINTARFAFTQLKIYMLIKTNFSLTQD